LNRQYADFEEFVAENDRNSAVAYSDSSSPYLERQVKAFVKAAIQSVVQFNLYEIDKPFSEYASKVACIKDGHVQDACGHDLIMIRWGTKIYLDSLHCIARPPAY
jgi:hypothetical protein